MSTAQAIFKVVSSNLELISGKGGTEPLLTIECWQKVRQNLMHGLNRFVGELVERECRIAGAPVNWNVIEVPYEEEGPLEINFYGDSDSLLHRIHLSYDPEGRRLRCVRLDCNGAEVEDVWVNSDFERQASMQIIRFFESLYGLSPGQLLRSPMPEPALAA